jgi:hypothetical protein
MKISLSRIYLAFACGLSFLVVGCGHTTRVRLSGSPGAQVSGHYTATHVSSEFHGNANWQMSFPNQRLEEFEVKKAALDDSVDLDISQDRNPLVHATAEPGVRGLRVRNNGGWTVEKLK